jgi:hypothetical protein
MFKTNQVNTMTSKYTLALTELNHPYIHGSSPELYSHYMCFLKITPHELYDGYPAAFPVIEQAKYHPQAKHPIIRDYINILNKKGAISLNIVKIEQKLTGEMVCILKTLWLRILQRKWRAYFKKKLAFYRNPKSLMIREINGSFNK